MTRPPHAVLFVPADNARALAKARSLRPDAYIIDLEDAVAPESRQAARDAVAAELRRGEFPAPVWLRLSSAAPDEIAWAAGLAVPPAALVLPKVEDAKTLEPWAALGLPLWPMVETPLGVLRAADLAAPPAVAGLIAGANDLAAALRCGPGREPLLCALSQVVLAARAHGKTPLDAVWNDIQDLAGLAAEAAQGKKLGFGGKTLIHPSHIAPVRAAYQPSEAEQAEARELLAAWENARSQGRSVVAVGGKMVEQMHADAARELLGSLERLPE